MYAARDEKCEADVAIILGADATEAEVSPVYRERINHGIWLYENGYVKTLIVTGGIGEGNSRPDADIAREYAISQGIPAQDIYVEGQSRITQEIFSFYAEKNSFTLAIESIDYFGDVLQHSLVALSIIVIKL